MADFLPRHLVCGRLRDYGFLPGFTDAASVEDDRLAAAVREYQKFHGLETDGIVGPETTRSLGAHRFCGLPDLLPLGTTLPRWPTLDLRWHLTNPSQWPNVPADVVRRACEWAWGQWAAVCAIRPTATANRAEAHVFLECGRIDGPMSTLAYSELADGTARQKGQRYDSDEPWVFTPDASVPQFRIDLGRVMAHEIGHVLGIPHIAAGNLLQPTYDPRIWSPQAGDIREAVNRYGPPVAPPPQPQPQPQPGGTTFTITVEGSGAIRALAATGFRIVKAVATEGEAA